MSESHQQRSIIQQSTSKIKQTPASSSATPQQQPRPEWDDADGHYIVKPSDNITGRYKVIRLLGQGTYGRVAECWDRTLNIRVAIKFIKAIQKYRDAARTEIRVLRTIAEHDPQSARHCIHMKDVFEFRGHICMVFGLLSVSVFDFLKSNEYRSFPMSHIQTIARQLFQAVEFLHGLSLVHTDLKPENILLLDNTSRTVRIRQSKRPRRKASHAQTSITTRILKDTTIRLIDFGSTVFESEYHPSVVCTRHYRAPEIILGTGWSYPCDVWSLGCILYEFATGEALFQTHDNLEHLAMMQKILGPFPQAMIQDHLAAAKIPLFKPNNKPTSSSNTSYIPDFPQKGAKKESTRFVGGLKKLEETITALRISLPDRDAEQEVLDQFLDLLKQCLDFDPKKRISAREALQHAFFGVYIDEEFEEEEDEKGE